MAVVQLSVFMVFARIWYFLLIPAIHFQWLEESVTKGDPLKIHHESITGCDLNQLTLTRSLAFHVFKMGILVTAPEGGCED